MIGFKSLNSLLVVALLIPGLGLAQFPFQPQTDPTEDIFLLAPRPLTRLLREAEIAFREGRYADGIAALSSILLDDAEDLPQDIRGQDYFIEPGVRGLFNRSVKGEAIRLLGELSPEGRRTLEIQFGVTAKRELTAAIQARDFERIGDVARKYVHTEAGYDAQILLAQFKMTKGYPLAAAGLLQELMGFPAARARYGPQLALGAARAWMLAGNRKMAELTLQMAAREFPGKSLELDGQQIPLDVDTDWGSLLARQADRSPAVVDTAANESWLISGGSPERNAISKAGMPLPTERWVKEIHSSLPEHAALLRQSDAEAQKGRVLLPKFELRMVGDLVLTKTTDASLLAIDFETGIIKWPLFFHNVPVQLTNLPFASQGGSTGSVSDELQNRVWGSSAFGKFSCDEQRLYVVSEETDRLLRSESVFQATNSSSDSNHLEGASLASQGAILWRVGGETGDDEPQLAGMYFLGPPLPYQGDLYALVESRGETNLVVLDAATGRLRWKQQLVHSTAPLLRFDTERRSQALSPTIAEGVILCPTGIGAVVAVDLLSRSLRWGATYTTNRPDRSNALGQRGAFGGGSDFSPLVGRWQEPSMIAQDGVVLISPPESDDMFCRDILTGIPRLAPQRRNSNRYIAGMRDGKIIVVGESQATAQQLDKGTTAWECKFPKGHTLAGKGLWQADSLILPLSGRQIIRVSTDDGSITDQCQVAQPVGNLFAYKDQLLSVSASAVSVYYTRESLSEQVVERLATNANDTWALNQQSQLSMARGDLDEAISSLTRSFELDPTSADTRYLLVELLLSGLVSDFNKFEGLAQHYSGIVEFGPQRFRFLQQLALGKIRSGQHLAAFESLQDLIPQVGSTFTAAQNRERDMELSPGYVVDSDAWIATELARAYASASNDEREVMGELVARQLASIKDTMAPIKRDKLRFLQWLPPASDALIELSSAMLGGEEQTVGEQLLQPLLLSDDLNLRAIAGRLLSKPAAPDIHLSGGIGEFPMTGRLDSFNEGPIRQPGIVADAPASEDFQWNAGMVRIDASNESRYHFGDVLDVVSERFGRPNLSVALSGPTLLIRNGNGDDRAHLEFPRASSDTPTDVFTRAQMRGGLLLIEMSSEIAAFDMYRGLASKVDSLLWRHSLFSPGAGPSREFAIPDVSSANSPFGFAISRRQMPGRQQAIVGPLTPAGIVIQIGTQVILLDALTGRQIWSRDGYDDKVRLAGHGLEVAVVNPSMAAIEIFDCRDGAALRQLEYRGDWRHWHSHHGTMVDFAEAPTVPPMPTTLRIWNALTGEEFQRFELAVGSRADVCEGRYLVILEPNSKLHYFDLEHPDHLLYASHEIENELNVESISVQRFQQRLVVLTNSAKSRRLPGDNLVPVNGNVFSIEIESGELTWPEAGRLFELQFPKSQPRQSPFMVAYRIYANTRTEHRATLALIDLRTGRLSYSSKSLPLRANVGFAMSLRPERQSIEMAVGARSLRFTITDQPRPPQPIFAYGHAQWQPAMDKRLDNLFPF